MDWLRRQTHRGAVSRAVRSVATRTYGLVDGDTRLHVFLAAPGGALCGGGPLFLGISEDVRLPQLLHVDLERCQACAAVLRGHEDERLR
jgi:hypothetical protein